MSFFPDFQEQFDFVRSFNITKIGEYELILTCHACPEQYDVLVDGKKVAYLRLRHGCFRVDVPECGDLTIFEAEPKGDGCFTNDERASYLYESIRRIDCYYNKTPICPICNMTGTQYRHYNTIECGNCKLKTTCDQEHYHTMLSLWGING